MKTILHKASTRGVANHGWLLAKHYFSFGSYSNKDRVHFGALRVLNNDWVEGGAGFPTHPHDNMEIVTIPLTGALAHQDSSGGKGVIQAGDVQIMNAGTGVTHSEFNASKTEASTLFQIWVFPKVKNITPRYGQQTFLAEERQNKFQTIVAPNDEKALWINQDAWFSLSNISQGTTLKYDLHKEGNGVYAVVIEGNATIDSNELADKDALGIWETSNFSITATTNTQLLLIEVPMEF